MGVTRGRLPQRAGLPGLNGGGAAAAVPPSRVPVGYPEHIYGRRVLTAVPTRTVNRILNQTNSSYQMTFIAAIKLQYCHKSVGYLTYTIWVFAVDGYFVQNVFIILYTSPA